MPPIEAAFLRPEFHRKKHIGNRRKDNPGSPPWPGRKKGDPKSGDRAQCDGMVNQDHRHDRRTWKSGPLYAYPRPALRLGRGGTTSRTGDFEGLLADKAFDIHWIIDTIRAQGARMIIP